MTTFKYFEDRARLLGRWRANTRVQHPQPGMEMTKVEAFMANYFWLNCAAMDHQWHAARQDYKFQSHCWLKSLLVRAMDKRHSKMVEIQLMILISVKLSSCICS